MAGHLETRHLTFERLEKKRCTAMLLAVAPMDDADQVALEHWLTSERPGADSAWRYEHDNTQLLRFIEDHTRNATRGASRQLPTGTACEAADRWLRLEAPDLRAILICESMQLRFHPTS